MDLDPEKLRRALERVIDRHNRLHGAFLDQLKRHVASCDIDEAKACRDAYKALTREQHELIEIALETGFRVGRPDAYKGDFIFIAHSDEDTDAAANLYDELGGAGLRCFMDKKDIRPGTDWDASLAEALDQCAGLIVLISSAAAQSLYLKAEVQAVFDQRKPVFPVSLDPTVSAAGIDTRLRTLMVTVRSDEPAVSRLIGELRSLY